MKYKLEGTLRVVDILVFEFRIIVAHNAETYLPCLVHCFVSLTGCTNMVVLPAK
jgi:hypothetical protein